MLAEKMGYDAVTACASELRYLVSQAADCAPGRVAGAGTGSLDCIMHALPVKRMPAASNVTIRGVPMMSGMSWNARGGGW
jgi:hypothetical protein